MNEYLEFAKELAKKAGIIMKEYFYKNNQIEYKSDKSPVTIADKLINKMVIEEVKKKYPNHGIDGEEEKYLSDREYLWVLDPIDGTSSYTRHIPISVFSLALVIDGEPSVGVVYDPYLDEMYTAIIGEGAYCNGNSIHVNNIDLNETGSTIDFCMWNNMKYDTFKVITELRKNNAISIIGSVARACMAIASGKISGELFPGYDHGHCDMAASKLIVTEAGGKVTSFYGKAQKYNRGIEGALISNGLIHDKLLEIIIKTEA